MTQRVDCQRTEHSKLTHDVDGERDGQRLADVRRKAVVDHQPTLERKNTLVDRQMTMRTPYTNADEAGDNVAEDECIKDDILSIFPFSRFVILSF